MKILLTGSTGYIGEAVAIVLREQGHEVLGLTRDASSPRATSLAKLGVRSVEGDVGDSDSYRRHLHSVEAVIHTVTDSRRPIASDHDLFHELQELGSAGRSPHLIYTTGCSVYGPHQHAVLTEETPGDATNGRFGLEEELRSSALDFTIVRPAFVFGRDGRSSLLGRWLREARDGSSIFYGNTEKVWSWIHVDDLARGFAAVVDRLEDVNHETFLFADDRPVRALDTFSACQELFDRNNPVTVAPIEDEDPLYQVFDRNEIVASIKANRRLGWGAVAPSVTEFIARSAAQHYL